MLISLFISEGLGHQWQVKVSTKLIVIKTDSSFQSALEHIHPSHLYVICCDIGMLYMMLLVADLMSVRQCLLL